MTLSAVRRLATAVLGLNVLLVVTGAAVRLSGSGLGCPTWPRCTAASLVNTPALGVHGYVEFGNRLLAVLLEAVALALMLAVLRLRPRAPRSWWVLAFVLALVVPVQAAVGGLLVLTGLNPYVLAGHFLISFPLILAAVALVRRVRDGTGPRVRLVSRELRWLTGGLLAVGGAVLVAGTVVTGTGPHAGDIGVVRLPYDPSTVTQLHADLVFLLTGLAVATAITARAFDAPAAVRRGSAVVVGLVVAQAALGYAQYYAGVPAPMVLIHVLGAALVFTAAAWTHTATSGTALSREYSVSGEASSIPACPVQVT